MTLQLISSISTISLSSRANQLEPTESQKPNNQTKPINLYCHPIYTNPELPSLLSSHLPCPINSNITHCLNRIHNLILPIPRLNPPLHILHNHLPTPSVNKHNISQSRKSLLIFLVQS